ncbi:WD40 repeat-like-containing domain protein [Metarhizium album ARSEF 1941]|uniref:WD40 repeat-like-containing domain protein n=1 Tax=Metarhizium album (strain ARSEF 1941) TaxID=1081103 RepID=A0A0B2WLG3_METAS|nr:WD40 repeat-like-containing domain protein [Metarhizium album ARSEF 1941]KHN96906.1 WD40 repeat-like-containing domain protein [Metarhizium album ARSEF 1941]
MGSYDFDPFEDVPDRHKTPGQGWAAKFNSAAPRTMDLSLRHVLMPSVSEVVCVRFSPDGGLVAVGIDCGVQIFRTDTRQMFCEMKHGLIQWGQPDLVRALCFLAVGNILAAAGDDGKVRLWDVNSRSVIQTFLGHEATVTCLQLSKDGRFIVSGSEDRTVRCWDTNSGQEVAKCVLAHGVLSLSVSPVANILAVGTLHGAVVLEGTTFEVVETIGEDGAHDNAVHSVAFSPHGSRLATASLDKTVGVWDMPSTGGSKPGFLRAMEGHKDTVLSVCWAENGRWVISGSKDGSFLISDSESGQTQATVYGHSNIVLSVTSMPAQRLFATAGSDLGRVMLWSYTIRAEPDVAPTADDAASAPRPNLKRPGSGLPLQYLPPSKKHFPIFMGDGESDWSAATLLIREVCMLKMLDQLTDKPEWWLKVHDAEITSRWKTEALGMDWTAYREYGDFTTAMADACIVEMKKKAALYEKTGLVPVLDYSACVVKSDTVAADLFGKLRDAVRPLENVPEDQKDWHPGSDGKVLDLVHPSLWPLVYARTRILTDKTCNVQDCMDACGQGTVLSKPTRAELVMTPRWPYGQDGLSVTSLSLNFQWLPCDVEIDEDGHASIDSYINNLNPAEHAELYSIIGGFIQQSLPAWDVIYRWPEEYSFQRLTARKVGPNCTTPDVCRAHYECLPGNRPVDERELDQEDDEFGPYSSDSESSSVRNQLDNEWFDRTHPVILPDAQPEEGLSPDRFFHLGPGDVRSSNFFNGESRIQVIVKLANIHLTPEKPTYEGGSWHIEGQLNEHICGTALFYYDNENITESRLAFRTKSNREELDTGLDYGQSDYRSIARTFAIDPRPGHDSTVQDIGSVLTRQGRAVFFPNLYQHQVRPFSLADPSRPGHRKILALFLVDPAIPVISTAQVPPQQPHWRAGQAAEAASSSGAAATDVIDWAEAVRIRGELMNERSALQTQTTERYEQATFNFCEH